MALKRPELEGRTQRRVLQKLDAVQGRGVRAKRLGEHKAQDTGSGVVL